MGGYFELLCMLLFVCEINFFLFIASGPFAVIVTDNNVTISH